MATTGYQAAIDSNDVTMAYAKETTWGTSPTTGAYQLIRIDSEGFSGSKSRTRPSEINPDSQASAAITTKEESTGSLGFSVSAGTHNELIEASLGSTFSTAGTVASGTFSETVSVALTKVNGVATISASSGATCTLVVSGAAFNSTDAAVISGRKIQVGTLGTAIATATGTTTTLSLAQCSWAPTDGSVNGGSAIDVWNATIASLSGASCLWQSDDLVVVGQMVKVSSALNKGIARVKTITSATAIILDMCSWVPQAETTVTMTMKGKYLRNGSGFQSFTFQKKLTSSMYLYYAGAYPHNGSLDVGVGDYLKGSLNFINKSQTSGTAALSVTSDTAAPTGTVIDSIKGIGTVWRGVDSGTTPGVPSPIQGVVQKLGIKWDREGAAGQYGIGSTAALGIRPGRVLVTGSMSTYFADFTLYNQFINEQTGPISFFALDGYANLAATKGYVITFCNANIMNPKVVAGGPGQDLMADFEVEGAPDVCSMYGGRTIQIDYFG